LKINLSNDIVEEIREQKFPETKQIRADSGNDQQVGIVVIYDGPEQPRKTPVKTAF